MAVDIEVRLSKRRNLAQIVSKRYEIGKCLCAKYGKISHLQTLENVCGLMYQLAGLGAVLTHLYCYGPPGTPENV